MNSGKNKDKKNCPRQNANFISIATFWWTVGVFIKGFRQELTEKDLYEPLKEHKAETLGNILEEAWEKEVTSSEKLKRKPNLHKVIFKVFGAEFMLYGVLIAFNNVGIRMLQAIALGNLVSCYSPDTKTTEQKELFFYAGLVISCALLVTLISHPTFLGILHVGMKIRVAVCSLLYRKSLRLSKTSLGETTIGQVVNLLSNDVSRFDGAIILLHNLWVGPLVTAVATYFMYEEIGLSAIAGVACILIFIPFQGWLGHTSSLLRLRTAIRTDERLRLMSEVINGIQVIKMYTWEKAFANVISSARKKELQKIKQSSYIRGLIKSFHLATTRTALFVTILTYLLLGNTISASKVFMVTACFDVIKQTMTDYYAMAITQFAEFDISIKRVYNFLLLDEVKKQLEINNEYTMNPCPGTSSVERKVNRRSRRGTVCLNKACARWLENSTDYTLSQIDLKIEPGSLVAIIGPVGSGKSSLLYTILRELSLSDGSIDVEGTVSYASQEPWLFVGTVRQNILFGRPMNKERYRAVIHRCSLDKDFKTFPKGDRTIVGERGVSLSGGQKARINLARAIYKKADIYLLDDPLSAVDTHVSTQLFQSCIGSYIHDKTRILITHQLQYLKHVNEIIVLDNGTIKARGSYQHLMSKFEEFSNIIDDHPVTPAIIGSEDEQKIRFLLRRGSVHSIGSIEEERLELVVDGNEHRSYGSISKAVYYAYAKAGGGPCIFGIVLFLFLLAQLAASSNDYFIGYWVNREEAHINRGSEIHKDNNTTYNLNEEIFSISFWHPRRKDCIYLYSAITILTILVTLVRSFVFFSVSIHASEKLHNNLFENIVKAPMSFFNSNPSGRILNRFSRDIGIIDETLPKSLIDCLQIGFSLVGIFVVVATVNPFLLIPTIIVLFIFFILRTIFLGTSRSVKRLEGITSSPVFSHMSASLQGLTTIRAFGATQALSKEFDSHQDLHSSAWYIFIAISQSFSYYLDLVCVAYIAAVTLFFIFEDEMFGGNVGLAVTQVMGLMGILQWGIRQSSEFENQMTSVERIQEYSKLETEDSLNPTVLDGEKQVSNLWPEKGSVEFYKLYLYYSPLDPPILKNLSFYIEPREKVGIVGRTGAGKSSLIAALFRLSKTDGTVLIDGRDTCTLSLHQLRSKISIIPQEPVLFSGTMRSNLDPLKQHSDHELWTALDQVELRQTVAEMPNGLSSRMTEGGANLSVGQRQLVCLARAIIRNNKILVLDEATANVDPHTDMLIQTTIRTKFFECTVLTIAHRLHTVMDSDRVLVMDAGTVAEFQHPHLLLQNPDGLLYKMVQQTGSTMAENLTKMAEENFNKSFVTQTEN